MLYAYFFECISKLYKKKEFLEKSKHIKKHILEMSFTGVFFEDQLIRNNQNKLIKTNHMSETCQYYAFFTNTISIKTHPKLFNLLKKEFGYHRDEKKKYPHIYKSNAFIGNYLRLEMLKRNNETEQLLKECKDYFSFMAKRTHTLWEHSYVFGSLNHGFASYAANLIIQSLTGIISYNEKLRTITYKKPTVKLDFNALIPFGSGIKISRHNGEFFMIIPSDITVIEG